MVKTNTHPTDFKNDDIQNDESAGAKIWSVYISEADKYDKALVERWRSDMEGILIFAGLFSASLTAFLIESYTTLSPDQNQLTVLILARISTQLAASTNISALELPPLGSINSTPPATAVACNILWFISLCLSLSCALIATLVEQWARNFMQATEMRPSPITRARIFSYLYYGVQRFSMHSVVEVIPLLLHTSLILFFAGLIAFLHPVNTIVTILAAVLLSIVSVVYFTFTILPIVYSDCPYRTPLSVVFWWARQGVLVFMAKRVYSQAQAESDEDSIIAPCYQPTLDKSTMLEVMTRHATHRSVERNERDLRALVWTVKSLTDDDELEPFIEGISAVLWSAKGRRKIYDDRIKALIYHPDVLLTSRIEALLRGCDGGLLSPDVEARRQIYSVKAVWAIARLSLEEPQNRQPLDSFDLPLLHTMRKSAAVSVRRHVVSALALVQYNVYCSAVSSLRGVLEALGDPEDPNPGTRPPILRFSSSLKKVERQMSWLRLSMFSLNPSNIKHFDSEPCSFTSTASKDSPSTVVFMNEISDRLRFLEDAPPCIFLQYLEDSADVDSMPYEFFQTCSGIPLTAIPASGVERTLQRIISTHSYRLKQQTEIHHMDTIVGLLLSLWKPESPTFESAPWIVEYISSRDSDETLSQALQSCDLDVLRSCMTAYLQVADFDIPTDNLLITIWRLCILSRRVPHPGSKFPRAFDTTALRAVQQTEFSLYSVPVIALIQCDILESVLQHRMETPDDKALLMAKLRVPILPGSTLPSVDDIAFLSAFRDVRDLLNMRYTEACFTILSDFLDGCNSPVLPHSTREAIEHITAFVPRTKLHASHQRRFASSLRGLVQANTTPAHNEIISRVMHSVMFNVYVRNGRTSIGHIKYLDDPEAQEIMGDALRSYVSTIPPGQFPTLVRRVTAIVSNINRPEFEQEPPTLQVSSSRRSFTHILGAEYRLLRPTR